MDYPDHSLLDAVAKTDCESQVKSQLLESLSKWKERRGFALVKYNREYVKILLELFLLEDRNISRQVSGGGGGGGWITCDLTWLYVCRLLRSSQIV